MIVALHGFTGAPTMWHSLGLTGPSLLGHGPESPAVGHESFAGEASRLAERLPASPVHLVGYSLGARLALAIALSSSEKIHALTLIGCNPGIENDDERSERATRDNHWCELLETQGIEAFVNSWQALPIWDSQKRIAAEDREALREQRLRHDPMQLAHALRALGTGVMPPMWKALGTLRMPVQILAGELDEKYREIGHRMSNLMPSASFREISGAGHNPVFEQPKTVRGVINEFA